MNRIVAALVVSMALGLGCSQAKGPEYASSAASPSYAERYPAALAATRARFTEDERVAAESSAQFSTFPGELTDPDWSHVAGVVERADAAGNSSDFVDAMDDVDAVNRFYAARHDKIRQKVSGSVAYSAQQKGCDPDVAAGVGGSLDKAIEQETLEWTRERNPAHRYIDDHEDELGKKNIDKLRKQADEIAMTSHVVRIRLPRAQQELEAQIADASTVKSTLEDEAKAQQAIIDDPNASKTAKDRAKERLTAVDAARTTLEQEVNQAQALSAEVEQRAKTALEKYEQALAALKDAIAKEAEKKP